MTAVSASTVCLQERLEGSAQTQRVPFAASHVTWRRFGEGAPLTLLQGGHSS